LSGQHVPDLGFCDLEFADANLLALCGRRGLIASGIGAIDNLASLAFCDDDVARPVARWT
jgi:hypothetical protein